MKIILLTHFRETTKKTNTGQLVQQLIPDTQTIIWQRTQPDKTLLPLIESEKIALLYPVAEGETSANINDFDYFILIDTLLSTSCPRRKVGTRKNTEGHHKT